MHALADLATNYGKGELRLTVWQNVLIPHVPDAFVETLNRSVQRARLLHRSLVRHRRHHRLHRQPRLQIRRRRHEGARASRS